MSEVIKVLRKNHPCYVIQKQVSELDKTKCSHKFLTNNLPEDSLVFVKCYENGEIDLRGKKEQYRIIPIETPIV